MAFFDAIDLFIYAKMAAGLSGTTATWYRWWLVRFAEWLKSERIGSDWCTPETIERWLSTLRAAGLSDHSVAGAYRTLNVFFSWLEERRMLADTANPMLQVSPPKTPRSKPRQIEIQQVEKLIESIPLGNWIDLRDRLAIQILWGSGLRAGELCNLEIADVDPVCRLVTVRAGKGGDGRPVPLSAGAVLSFKQYNLIRPRWPAPWVLLSASGGARHPVGVLSVSGLRQMLKRRCASAGIPYANPHSFRHGLAMQLLNSGGDMSLVQKVLGHSRIQTTATHYAHWETVSMLERYEMIMTTLKG